MNGLTMIKCYKIPGNNVSTKALFRVSNSVPQLLKQFEYNRSETMKFDYLLKENCAFDSLKPWPYFILTANIPDSETDVFIFNSFNIESNGWNGRDDFP